MTSIPLILPTGSVIGKDGEVATARLINAYAEQVERDGKAAYVIYGTPGLTRWDTGNFTGAERGMIQLDDNNLIVILGNEVVKFDTGGNGTVIGTLVGSDRVIMSKDRAIPNEIAIVTKDGQYYLITGGDTISKISDSDLPSPTSVTYLAGHFLYGIPDGRFFASDIDDGSSINAAALDTANSSADGNVRVYAYGNYAYVFGKQTVEIWQPDPGLADQPFPYSNTKEVITVGLLAPNSIAELDNGMVWVDDNGIVRYGRDANPQRLSTHTVERAIASLSLPDKQAIFGSVMTYEGHKVYEMTSSSWSWVYDAVTQQWRENKSYGISRRRTGPAIQFGDKYILGDKDTGKLYYLDPSAYTEDGNVHELEIWCGVSHRFPGQMIIDKISIDIVAGVGLASGNVADTDPHMLIDFSDDGGKTFQGERAEPIGKIGEFGTTVESFMWGLVKEKGRIWRFRASAAVLKAVIQANLIGRPVRG